MKSLRFNKLLCVWLNPTSASVVTGGKLHGGQAHINLGKIGDQIRKFFVKTGVKNLHGSWNFQIEASDNFPRHSLEIAENPEDNKRSRECRITSQLDTSPGRHPLWEHAVTPLKKGDLPRQIALIARDFSDRFHLRVLDADDLVNMPVAVATTILNQLPLNGGFLVQKAGQLPVVSTHRSRPVITATPGSSRQRDWKRFIQSLGVKKRRVTVSTVKKILRNPKVREMAIACFGPQCQVENCVFTTGIPSSLVSRVLDVHHMSEVAKGGSDLPLNLCVICANHHRLCHTTSIKAKIEGEKDIVIVRLGRYSFLIRRDFDQLRKAGLAELV